MTEDVLHKSVFSLSYLSIALCFVQLFQVAYVSGKSIIFVFILHYMGQLDRNLFGEPLVKVFTLQVVYVNRALTSFSIGAAIVPGS